VEKEIIQILELINKQNIDKAYVEATKYYSKNKSNKKIMNIVAYLLIQKNKFEDAIDLQENFYKKNNEKEDFDFYINMGVSFKSIEEYKNSEEMFAKAKEINSESPLTYMTPAEIKLKLRKFEEALKLIDVALKIIQSAKDINRLQMAHAIRVKSDILIALNRQQENYEFLKEQLDQSFNSDVFFFLIQSNPSLIEKKLIELAESRLKSNEIKFVSKLDRFWNVHPLYFGLAKYYEKVDKTKSEELYVKGNLEVNNSLRFNSYNYQKQILLIINNFNQQFSNLSIDDENMGEKNIFILGSPRSGTTLIESIIGSSNNVMSAGELLSASRLIERFLQLSEKINVNNFIEDFQDKYISRVNYIKANKEFVVDKLPENFSYIGYINKILPKSKIIRTFRHPWDVATSLFKQRYVANIPYSCSFFNIGVFFANFEAINKFWDKKLDQKNILDIRYEELVSDSSSWQKTIYKFIGIDGAYNEENRQSFFSPTASMHQISSPVHQKSVSKDDFYQYKSEFYDAFHMQRKYWEKQGFINQEKKFYGYNLD
tara:strand:- start:1691 stop:3319 length:1629 start_codon:yes stop_codon:yes gene_type:complete